MKKNVIALLLSVVLATGSIGTVPVMAAETVVQDEALGETEEAGDAALASEEVEDAEADAEQQIEAAPETSTEVAEEEPEQDQEEPAGEGEEQEKETLEEPEESAVESDTSAAIAGVEDAEDAKADAEQQDESLPETSTEVAEEEPEKGQGETLEEPEKPDMESDTSAAIFGTGEPEDAEADAEQQAESDSETSTEVAEEEPEQRQKETAVEDKEQQEETLEEPVESGVESDTSAAIAGTEEAAAAEEELLVGEAKLVGDVVDSGICGGDATWKLTGTDSDLTLTISGSGEMKDFDKSSIPWETKKDKIKTIVVEDGITSVGNYAFYSLNNTTSVSLGGKVSSIGFYAFSNCVSLKSVTIPGSMIYISDCAFEDCTSLASITIPDGVTSIGYNTFADCSSLISITIPDGVKEIRDCAFENCRSLKNVTIPDSVMSIGDGVFGSCSSLTSVRIPDSVTSIGFGVFSACSSLTSVRIPESVTSIENYTFYGCSSLMSVTIPDSVTSIGSEAFRNCSSLASITIPDGVTSIGSEAFRDCSSLKSITVPDSVISIGSEAFRGCSSLKSITIPDGVTRIENNAFCGCSSLVSITIPNRVTSIGEFAINSCSSLKSVRIPVSVTSIGYYAFFGCRNLKTVYYDGTKAEWDAIEKDDSRLDINNLVLHTSDGVFGSVRAEKIALNKTSATLVKGASLQLKATVTPEDAADRTVTWKSSNTKVATVTSTGKVKAVSAGTTTITAMTGEGKLKASCTIKVVNPYTINFNKNATKATLKTSSKKVNPGSAIGELPTPNYSGYYFLGWYTDRSGGTKVTPSTKPTKNMTLYAHWVVRKSIKKATVKVGSCMYTGKWCKPSVAVMLGTKTLKKYEDYSITYSNCLDAGSKGVIKITGKGRYKDSISRTFTVSKCSMGEKYISAELSKTTYNYTGKAIKPGITVYLNGRYKLTKGKDYKVTYKNNIEPGKATVQITGMGNFESKSRYFTFTIAKLNQPIKLSRTSLSLQYKNIGTTYDATATGVKESAGMSVSSSNTSVATVSGSSGKYKIKIKGCGKTNIIFKTNKATKHYKITSIKLPITVADRKMPTISLPQQAYDLDIGDAEFNLMATTDSDGSLTYTSSDVDIVNVDNIGKVTLTGNKEGAVIITITSKATVNYKENTASVSINVTNNRLYWPVRKADSEKTPLRVIGKKPGDIVAGRSHRGIDIANSEGAHWYSATDGTIHLVLRGCITNGNGDHSGCNPNHPKMAASSNKYGTVCNDGFGNGVVVKSVIDGKTYYFQYAHMNSVSESLKEGDEIKKGTYLGEVGDRGFSFGPHAHFEVDLETTPGSYWGSPVNNNPESEECVFKYKY